MAYVYDGDIYRGGATGVTNDFDLRQIFAQMAAQGLTAGMNMPTQGQADAAQKQLGYSYGMYQDIFQNGLMTPDEEQAILSNRVQNVNNSTRAMQQNFNTQMAARGLGGNAGAQAALGMAGQFEAAGQRGQAFGDIQAAEAQARGMAASGIERVGDRSASLHMTPLRMDIDENDYMDLYNKFRNAQVGYDGAQWGSRPEQPDFYAGGSGSGFQYGGAGNGGSTTGGDISFGGFGSGFSKKKSGGF